MSDISRRGLLAGVLISATAAPVVAHAAVSASPWLSYDARLRARLADAGGGAFLPRMERELLGRNNGLRARYGLAPYAWDARLAACARAHAGDMARRGYFDHQAPEGFTPFDRASLLVRDLCGPIAENLASREHRGHATDAGHLQTLWETSPGHRENLLHPSYTRAGIGVVRVGQAYVAAAVYGDPAVRLARAIPLRVRGAEELAPAIAGASPHIDALAFTRPGEEPYEAAPARASRMLAPGVWQLRPMRAAGGGVFDVLTGPLFVVG